MKKKELLKRIEYLENQISVLSNKINPKHKYTSPYDPKYLKTVIPQDYKTDYIGVGVTKYETIANVVEEEKKELVVGKWYKCDDWMLMYDKDLDNCSGWYKNHYEYKYWSFDTEAIGVTEATPEEVESALIKEAKRLGHKYDVYSWNHEQNTLYGNRGNDVGHDILFENGVWSEVIKPEEKPKIGDVCKFWNYDENNFEIAKLVRVYSEKETYKYASGASSWMNAKTLTQQEAIDLLFNK